MIEDAVDDALDEMVDAENEARGGTMTEEDIVAYANGCQTARK